VTNQAQPKLRIHFHPPRLIVEGVAARVRDIRLIPFVEPPAKLLRPHSELDGLLIEQQRMHWNPARKLLTEAAPLKMVSATAATGKFDASMDDDGGAAIGNGHATSGVGGRHGGLP
jgi:hypothetical protein